MRGAKAEAWLHMLPRRSLQPLYVVRHERRTKRKTLTRGVERATTNSLDSPAHVMTRALQLAWPATGLRTIRRTSQASAPLEMGRRLLSRPLSSSPCSSWHGYWLCAVPLMLALLSHMSPETSSVQLRQQLLQPLAVITPGQPRSQRDHSSDETTTEITPQTAPRRARSPRWRRA